MNQPRPVRSKSTPCRPELRERALLLSWFWAGTMIVVAGIIIGGVALWRQSAVNPQRSQPLGTTARPGTTPTNTNATTSATPCSNASQSPIYGDETYVTTTSDPLHWPAGTRIAQHASVPDIIELRRDVGSFQAGDLLVYYIDSSCITTPGSETLAVIASRDHGKSWSAKQTVTVVNKPNQGATVDPSIVQLPDGRLRLYFFGSEVSAAGPATASTDHRNKVYSATSQDGVQFSIEDGMRFADDSLTDPEVIQFQNQWFMYYSIGTSTKLATSPDGLQFTAQTISGGTLGGVPGALVVDQRVYLFSVGNGGLVAGSSTDGLSFTKSASDVFGGAVNGSDPSIVRSAQGGYVAVYKVKTSQPSMMNTNVNQMRDAPPPRRITP